MKPASCTYSLIDNLAHLTGLRDRDALDVALANTIGVLLHPCEVVVCRIVDEQGQQRWRTSAQMLTGQSSASSDKAWLPLEQLPLLSEYPLRQLSVSSGHIQEAVDGQHVLVFPLGGTQSGVLEIQMDTPPSEGSRELVNGVLRLYRNFTTLLEYGERDSLTDLLNRKTFDGAFLRATLEQTMSEAVEQSHAQKERRDTEASTKCWLTMIDIDHFKKVNDSFGHLIGDEVLLLLARLMRAHFRFHDQIYRFGGEEFVALVRCHSETEAENVLDRLRMTTQDHLFPQVGTITISIGFTEVRAGDSPSSAIERADKAVYYAKEHGRNQVCSYSTLISIGALIEPTSNIGDVELF